MDLRAPAATDTAPVVMRDGGRSCLPPEFHQWDRDARINYLTLGHTRADLLAHIRGYIGSERGSDRLSKDELAKIADDLEVLI